MRLKNLEIKGFKSFADKTVININESITGVVGPNGCGKSNIVDAIRWVLGEQKSSLLRSEKMENLIFNGTKKRRSSSLAEVSLTFENTRNVLPTEYSSVTVSRHYFRSGESEYRLNDVPCRLKDITNLFMDTGVGSDSYAIIELSMVDDILNDKDNSRRRLFEQAAGIEKYKKRKKETLSKLKSAEADLERVDDLLYEIETHLKTLESQARRAKKYYKLKDQYKELSIELAVHLLSDQKTAFERLTKQLEDATDKKMAAEAIIKKLDSEIQVEKKANIEKETHLSKSQRQLNEFLSQLQEKENEKKLLAENSRYNTERAERLKQEIKSAKELVEGFHQKIKSLGNKIEKQSSETEKLDQEVTTKKEKLDSIRDQHDRKRADTENKRQELEAIDRAVFELEKKMAINQVVLDNLSSEMEKGTKEEKAGKEALDKLNQHLNMLDNQVKLKEKELSKLNKKEENHQEEIKAAEKIIDQIKSELEQENRHLDASRNEFDLTKNLIDSLEGYPESIKFLRREVKYTKYAPLLSDVISCKEEYRAAIENYLEPYLNYYVVNTLDDAVQSIDILNEASKGRANFFILSSFNDYQSDVPMRTDNAISALDILEVEPKYHQMAAYLLDNVYFIDDLSPEISIERKNTGKQEVYITRSGKYIRGRFSLSGGAVGLFEGNKLGRKKSLDRLNKSIKKHENKSVEISQKLHTFQKNLQELKEINIKQLIDGVKEEIYLSQQETASIKTSIDHAKKSIGTATDNFKSSLERIESIQKENSQTQLKLEEVKAKREKLADHYNKSKSMYQGLIDNLKAANETFNSENIRFHQQENLLKSYQQEMQFAHSQLNNTEKQITDSQNEIGDLNTKLKSNSLSIKKFEEELKAGYGKKEEMELLVRKSEEIYYASRDSINELDEKVKGENQKKASIDQLAESLKDQLNDLKLNLTSMKERLSVEFNADLNELLNRDPDPQQNLETLGEQVEKIKQKLEFFGEINPMAVEAHNEMKERFDFITSQKTDLLEARENLLKTIEEIDVTAKARFLDSFENIRSNFQRVFRTLFTDDDACDLILNEISEPLDSKIEIIAKPKGKRPLTINQLSGGEKTLTAIALLFALYLIKPAPFCVFDEVDAPLDDTNIDKFTKIIREFSKDSQFIIVTHNKQTMSTVDIIYGVTMIEEGVSKVVPVDFRNLN